MQFEDFPKDARRIGGADSQADPAQRSAIAAWKASALTTTTVALSMLAFNIAAFLPAGATAGQKPVAKPALKAKVIAAHKVAAKPAAKKLAVAKAAPAKPAATAVAQAPKPYLPKHRSIWAIKWAAAHPDQEAIFQAQLERRWAARHHLPVTGVAKAFPASHAATKVAAKPTPAKPLVKHPEIKVAKAAPAVAKKIAKAAPLVAKKVAKAKPIAAKPAIKVATAKRAFKPVKLAAKPAVKTVAKAATIAAAPAAIAAAHEAAIKVQAAKHKAVKIASINKPAATAKIASIKAPVAKAPVIAKAAVMKAAVMKAAVVKTAIRPASKAHVRPVRLAKAHVAQSPYATAHDRIRIAAIKSAIATSRHYEAPRAIATPRVKLASLPTKSAILPLSGSAGEARQHQAAATSLQGSDDVTLDFVAADINDVLKALAVQTGANIVSSADVKGTVTVSLANVTLEQALDMVARLSGFEYAKVGNTYVIGSPSGIQALTGSSGSSTQQVTQVVTFNYASPDDVTAALKQRFPTMQISTGTAISGEKAGAGTKALILSGDPAMVSQAKDLVVQIDQSLGANVANESTVSYKVKYASLPDLITILSSLVPALVVTPGPSQGFTSKAPSASASASSSSGSVSGSSGGGGSSAGYSSGGAGGGATGGSQSSATGPNILLLTGTDGDIARAQQILGQVDIQPKQLLFETKITEISADDERKLGLNWDFSGATTRIGEEPDNIVSGTPTLGENGENSVLKFGVISRTAVSDLANLSFNANETSSPEKILADPNIAAIDGQPAQIFIGDDINYVSSITTSTTGENVTTASVQVGITFRVTGKVDSDGYITLNIHPEVSTLGPWVNVPGGGQLPDVITRYADTTVRVKDGETIAIGGLIQESDTETINKVPGLADLPLIGQLFRFNDHHKTKDQVVFFLKTSIMNQQSS